MRLLGILALLVAQQPIFATLKWGCWDSNPDYKVPNLVCYCSNAILLLVALSKLHYSPLKMMAVSENI